MKMIDPATGTAWLNVTEFAARQNKPKITIYKWVENGFILQLGMLIHRDVTNRIRIGIPRQHDSYHMFVGL